MTRATRTLRLPDPPERYDIAYMRRLIQALEENARSTQATGRIEGTTAKLSELPTSSTGLAAGELWNDGGTVKVIP